MGTPILSLDALILASAAYPSGFSQSLYVTRRGAPDVVSTSFLGTLVLPYAAILLAVWHVRPALLGFCAATVPMLAAATLIAPAALLLEYALHALAMYRASHRWPRGVTLQRFWSRERSPVDHLLLLLVVVGEEIVFRQIWLGVLEATFGFQLTLALGISSLAYGLNHLAFGPTAVLSKSMTGLLYGGLYLLGGRSIWLPIVAHVVQNEALFGLTRENHE